MKRTIHRLLIGRNDIYGLEADIDIVEIHHDIEGVSSFALFTERDNGKAIFVLKAYGEPMKLIVPFDDLQQAPHPYSYRMEFSGGDLMEYLNIISPEFELNEYQASLMKLKRFPEIMRD